MARDAGYRRMLYRMGYYDYQQGLVFRHLNQEGGWDLHLGRCRDFILSSVKSCKPAILTVLGSGWLLDLPPLQKSKPAREGRREPFRHCWQISLQEICTGNGNGISTAGDQIII